MKLTNIHYHPNNHSPVRFRLQVKELNIQEYFSFRQFGSEKKALNAAKARRDELLKIHNLRKNMGFRQLFKDDGFIRGITFTTTMRRRNILLGLHVSTDGKRAKRVREHQVNASNLDALFFEYLDQLLLMKKITLDAEDKVQIKKIRMNYIREYHRLNDQLQAINKKTPLPPRNVKTDKPDSIFTEDNKIVGLKFNALKTRKVVILRAWVRKDGKMQRVTDRQVTPENFNATFTMLVETIAKIYNIKLSNEDLVQLKKTQQKYRREYNRLAKSFLE